MYEDVLSGRRRRFAREPIPEVPAEPGLVVEDAAGDFCGAVVACDKHGVTLEDRFGRRRVFPLERGAFLLEGKPVTLRARVAKESRIYVEGVHDAELVEKIWGHDLRVEGVVVEYLEGIDDLPRIVAEFGPGPERRLGVLVDHLVPGSKESRIAEQVASPYVLVVGHPFVDIWQAVKPSVLGIPAWPEVPKGVPWKEGVLAALGWRMDPGEAWRHILGRVTHFKDLEPELLGRVEELIDFVSPPPAD